MTGFSLRWYLMDSDNIAMEKFAPILRYIDSIRFGILSRYTVKAEKETQDPAQIHVLRMKRKNYFTLMVYEDADATLLRLFECFMESAPQNINHVIIGFLSLESCCLSQVIKVYLSQKKQHQCWWKHFSIPMAFSFNNCESFGIKLVCLYISYVDWSEACRTPCEEFLFAIVLGAIYIFSFFNAKEERTRFKYLIYYGFCFLENAALIVIWFLRSSPNNWYYYPGIIGHYFSFFGGQEDNQSRKNSFNVDINNYSNNKTSKPISASSRCLSSPILDDVSQESKLNNKRSTVRRSSSAPSSRSPILYHVEARRLKDMAGRFRV
ncbi:unnamed protein product [Lepeophtheirus salmonis]|uniref:XK-related protein n=1 Tax=Lepeophtheirus salmonis TaxID=72036 RepID=A0A7R8CH03_LEPSM|nr:unnamed protein product [Lepeophtheirus salmonis]CAF2763122.1 unnamed protein product [Lepeophtheirus salmonis]